MPVFCLPPPGKSRCPTRFTSVERSRVPPRRVARGHHQSGDRNSPSALGGGRWPSMTYRSPRFQSPPPHRFHRVFIKYPLGPHLAPRDRARRCWRRMFARFAGRNAGQSSRDRKSWGPKAGSVKSNGAPRPFSHKFPIEALPYILNSCWRA